MTWSGPTNSTGSTITRSDEGHEHREAGSSNPSLARQADLYLDSHHEEFLELGGLLSRISRRIATRSALRSVTSSRSPSR